MPFADLPTGVRLHYLDPNPSGSPAVLLLHGLGATGESWKLQFPPLIDAGMRPIAPSARGFGQSSYPGGKLTIAVFAEDMAALLEKLGTSPAHVVGISMGGTIALQLALSRPDMVRKLVLVSTFAKLHPKGVIGRLYFVIRLIMAYTFGIRAQAGIVARRIFPKPEQESLRQDLIRQVAQANPRAYRGAMMALGQFDVEDLLSTLQVPTLVITGSEDTNIPPENQQPLVERIPGARQVVIQGGGHAVSADSPEAFNQVILEFLG